MAPFNLNDYLADRNNLRDECKLSDRTLRFRQPIRCVDGLNFSAQANSTAYCAPRNDDGPYTAVEVGFPSQRVEALMAYAEDSDRPTQTVYGWVPVEVVEKIVNDHGGLAPRAPGKLDAIEMVRYDSPDQIFN